jgi:GntR family transcriptional regulator, transcriptional repressor for pyruvate dehydrogenase complex
MKGNPYRKQGAHSPRSVPETPLGTHKDVVSGDRGRELGFARSKHGRVPAIKMVKWSDHFKPSQPSAAMPIQAIEPRRLYRQIADQLRALILSGEYAVGTRLPAERDLASRLEVSRPSVREALIALEVEGYVEVRPGSGIHVLAREAAPRAALLKRDAAGPFEIMGARHLIEGELAALAALHATAAQIDGLHEALALMDQEVSSGAMPIDSDRLFHLRVAEVADNGLLLRSVTDLYDQRNNPLFEMMGHHFENERTWRLAIAEHRAVTKAIAAHKPDAARAAMHRHLKRSQERFADAWPPLTEPAAATPA